MSKFADSIYKLNNNPFVFSPLFIQAYKNFVQIEKNILLSYLILPLVLNQNSCKSLKYSKSNSSMQTFSSKNENLFGLTDRIELYKPITNLCLQYLIDNKVFTLNENLSIIIENTDRIPGTNRKDDYMKAAAKIHNIFKDFDVISIYRELGVKKL
ncbi:MAG: three component ABC system middle component [Rhodothermaceae bacterium]